METLFDLCRRGGEVPIDRVGAGGEHSPLVTQLHQGRLAEEAHLEHIGLQPGARRVAAWSA